MVSGIRIPAIQSTGLQEGAAMVKGCWLYLGKNLIQPWGMHRKKATTMPESRFGRLASRKRKGLVRLE